MYPWVTHTWNAIKGKCIHDCKYCYMKRFPLNPVRLDTTEFKTDLGEGNVIFVGSSCDMWAKDIPSYWITRVLDQCKSYPLNSYLFQTKNPERFFEFIDSDFVDRHCKDLYLGCTIESNRDYKVSKAPSPAERVPWMWELTDQKYNGRFRTMVSIEPVLDFDLDEFIMMMKNINPEFVSIGADSKNHDLPEPDKEKTNKFIKSISKFTKVRIKENLDRVIGGGKADNVRK